MRRCTFPLALFFLIAPLALPARAEAPKYVFETWHAAYFEGIRAGHVHTTVQKLERDGKTVYRTTRAMNLKVRRYNAIVPMRFEAASEEAADGKVLALSLTQFDDKDGKLTQTGTVEDGKLVLRKPRLPRAITVPWAGTAIGMYKQELIYKERKVKTGDRFDFVNYEVALPAPLTIRVAVKEPQTVDAPVASNEDGKLTVKRMPRKMLRVEARPDKITIGESSIQLPRQVSWLDKDLMPVRYQTELPGMGQLTLYQTTQEAATQPGLAPEQLPDLGLNTIITVSRVIDRPYETRSATYRITVKDDDDAGTTFARDGRQEVSNVKGNRFDIMVKNEPGPGKGAEPGKEFLESSHFLDCDFHLIGSWAKRITRGEDDPWRKAQRLEKWVHDNMKGSNAIGLATASQIMRERTGDCRQHAMLLAALCRAAKVPARTAIGLIYARQPDQPPQLIFHMWTEVWVDGRWTGLDATLGRGGLSACHIKVTDHSWRDTQTLAPLLPVARVLGKISVEVLDAR